MPISEGFAFTGSPHRFQIAVLEKAVAKYGIPVAMATRGDYGRAPRSEGDLFIECDNLMAVKARLLLTLVIEKLGMLTQYKDFKNPTSEERARLLREIQHYQHIFDTH